MALRHGQTFFWPSFSRGLDHEGRSDQQAVTARPGYLLVSENVFWRAGALVRRGGTVMLHNPNDAFRITGGIRFYRGVSKETVVASNTRLYRYVANHTSRSSIKTGLANDVPVFLTPYRTSATVDTALLYIANGSNVPMTYDLSTVADFTPTNLPADVKFFVAHQDRLFAAATTNPLHLYWCGSLAPNGTWTPLSKTIGIPSSDPAIRVLVSHAQTTADAGIVSELLICTDTQIWVVVGSEGWGADGEGLTAFLGSDIRLHNVSSVVGSVSPKTFVNVPGLGMIFLGRMYGRTQPMLLGGFGEQAQLTPILGLRADMADIPNSELRWACATWADGHYMLSVTGLGETKNSREWWLRTDSLIPTRDGLWGAWYGPMIRRSACTGINAFIPFGGGTDENELLLGDSGSGRLCRFNVGDDDEGTAVRAKIRTGWRAVNPGHPMRFRTAFVNAERLDGQVVHTLYLDYGNASIDQPAEIIPIARIGTFIIGVDTIGGAETGLVALDLGDSVPVGTSSIRESTLDGTAFSQEIVFETNNTPFTLHQLGVRAQTLRYELDRVSL